jgi:class 3 adenylate cyclase
MAHREFHYVWDLALPAAPEELWPLIADTNRFDRDSGLPSVQALPEKSKGLTNARRVLRLYRFGVPLEWVEEPAEWIRPHRFTVVRHYTRGPVGQLRVQAELKPGNEGGTHLHYQVWARPRNWLGYVAIPAQIGVLSKYGFNDLFKRYGRAAAQRQTFLDLPGHDIRFAPGGRERLATLQQGLLAQGANPAWLSLLVRLIEQADDLTLERLRPYALADHWSAPRRDILELCLLATRAGLLTFRWDILCPLCRVAKESSPTLGTMPMQAHCDTCNIDYQANFEWSVEITFRPNLSVRLLEATVAFCAAGPQTTPHIVVQQLLAAGASRPVQPLLEPGRYRLRTLAMRGGQFIQVMSGGPEEVALRVVNGGWSNEEVMVGPKAQLTLINETAEEQLFILERMAWTDQATAAAEVTVLQRFRDLFANEALRPGEQVSVGSLTVLFTDLRNSTRLYREIGDAPAFGLVMDHFDVLREAIAAEEGAIVKTIGDAVMAVFRRPAAALRAIIQAQRVLAAPPDGSRPLLLKAGMNHGPCIAVNLNDRLDYFGSVVNMAARLDAFSTGGDVVVSRPVYEDPEVQAWLAAPEQRFAAEAFTAQLKGFDEQDFDLWRLRML